MTKSRKRRDEQDSPRHAGCSAGWWPSERPIEPLRRSPLKLPGWAALLFLILGTGLLNTAGIDWGLPNMSSWNSDSIAGMKTVQMLPRLWKSWRMADAQGRVLLNREGKPIVERYPRGHFLITGTLYKPLVARWQQDPVGQYRDRRTGQMVAVWHSPERVSILIMLSRIVTVLMAVGAVLGVFATVRVLCRDTLAGLLAAMVLMFCAEFTYFSHLGNLDTPVTFWFIWTAYWTVRAMQEGRWRYFVLLGLFGGMTVCTKDPSLGHLGGLALFLIGSAIYGRYRKERSMVSLLKVLIEGRLWVALLCFAVVFILMNDVLTDREAFRGRMDHWLEVKDAYKGSGSWQKQWGLFKAAVHCFRWDCGVWMFAALVGSFGYCLWKHRVKALWALAPFVLFHLTITTGAWQVQPRYHIPSLAVAAVLMGLAGSDLLRARRLPAVIRVTPLVLVFVLEALFAVAIDAEMMNESRYRAEDWIRANLDKNRDQITFISPSTYMPRSLYEGYKVVYNFENMTTAKSLQHRPKLIALSDMWYMDRLHFDQGFRKKLLSEQLGYRRCAEFGPRYTPPAAKGVFYLATLTTRVRKVISPTVLFMERIEE